MKTPSWLSLVLFSYFVGASALARPSEDIGTDTSQSTGAASFKAIYAITIKSGVSQENELAREADEAARESKNIEAAAKYLAAGRLALMASRFERARPNLDKCFLIASKLSVADQSAMLSTLSEILWRDARDAEHDYDTSKYLAQQRLKLMRRLPGVTAADRYSALQTLAFRCFQHKRYSEAEALLLETLHELRSIKPTPESVGSCEEMLARVYENAGDVEKAKRYYAEATQFVLQRHHSDTVMRVLGLHAQFLIRHKISPEAVLVADQFLKEATSPEQADSRVSFGVFARGLADIDVDESDKFYRAEFESQKAFSESVMNSGYGYSSCEWAEMLNKHGRTNEAISVLNEGMFFCRSSKWPNALQGYMPQMAKKCEEYLRATGQTTEADNLHAAVAKEIDANKAFLAQAEERKIAEAISNPSAEPLQKVAVLTEMANRSFETGKCDQAVSYLEEALRTYENNATSKDNPRMYERFLDVRRNLTKCGRGRDCKPMLLRIVKARMMFGYPDPDTIVYRSQCGGRQPDDPIDDLFPAHPMGQGKEVIDSTQDSMLPKLIDEAKAANKITTVVFLLAKLTESQSAVADKVGLLEEAELWKAKESDSDVLLQSMMRTANAYKDLKQYDKMMEKCKAAIAISEKPDRSGNHSMAQSLGLLANELAGDRDQRNNAEYLYMTAYKFSLHERGSDYYSREFLKVIGNLADNYRDMKDVAAGASLLEKSLAVTKTEDGEDGPLARAWLMKLCSYYVAAGQGETALKYFDQFSASVSKPGMTIATATKDEMITLTRFLKESGYSSQAASIESRLRVLDQQQCAAH